MPIYAYRCLICQGAFELIRPIKEADAHLTCPFCQGTNVKRQLSLFNASVVANPSPPAADAATALAAHATPVEVNNGKTISPWTDHRGVQRDRPGSG